MLTTSVISDSFLKITFTRTSRADHPQRDVRQRHNEHHAADLVDGKYINHGMPVVDVEHWVGHPIDHFHVAESVDVHGIGIREHEIAAFYRPHPPGQVVVHAGRLRKSIRSSRPAAGTMSLSKMRRPASLFNDYYNKLDAGDEGSPRRRDAQSAAECCARRHDPPAGSGAAIPG